MATVEKEVGAGLAHQRGSVPATVSGEEMPGLLKLAIEQKVSVELLERLVALQERVTDRAARASYVAALSAFQSACPSLHKSTEARISKNGTYSHSYFFAPLDEIATAIRPLLDTHGFSYSWDSKVDGPLVHVTCRLQHRDGHSETATFSCPWETPAAMSGAQKYAGALTFGRRQSMVQVLGLTTTEKDTDGEGVGNGAGPELITDSQLADLEGKIREVGADRGKFLQFLKVEKLGDLPANRLRDALQKLEEKHRRGAA